MKAQTTRPLLQDVLTPRHWPKPKIIPPLTGTHSLHCTQSCVNHDYLAGTDRISTNYSCECVNVKVALALQRQRSVSFRRAQVPTEQAREQARELAHERTRDSLLIYFIFFPSPSSVASLVGGKQGLNPQEPPRDLHRSHKEGLRHIHSWIYHRHPPVHCQWVSSTTKRRL